MIRLSPIQAVAVLGGGVAIWFFFLGLSLGRDYERGRDVREIQEILRSGVSNSTEAFILAPMQGQGQGNGYIIEERR